MVAEDQVAELRIKQVLPVQNIQAVAVAPVAAAQDLCLLMEVKGVKVSL
jgi:hypothetical protein